MAGLSLLFVVAATVTFVAGSAVTSLAVRAARRTRTASLWALALGVGLITLGTSAAWTVTATLGPPASPLLLAMSALTAGGFAVLAYAAFVDRPPF
ncbi:MAG: hypothetical protein ABEJ67_01105 [Halanaeroarchaeum sp.]